MTAQALSRREVLVYCGGGIAALAFAGVSGCRPGGGGGALIGKAAPEFSLADLKGNAIRLANLKGRIVFVNVWATWCEPCRQEMPAMQKLYTTLAGRDFEMLAVSSDQSQREVIERFVLANQLTFPVLLDPDLQVADRYRVTGYPETFVIDRNGTVVAHEIGPRHWDAPGSVAAFQKLIERGEWVGL
ncbi:MAG: TlpA disulfide reductase family protein [Candidatus Binatia bacterium]